MNPAEYEMMASVEADHWWYRALRERIGSSIDRFWLPQDEGIPQRPESFLDAGCGTGQNVRFLSERFTPAYLGGFDSSPAAIEHSRQKQPTADIYASDLCDPVLHRDVYDVVISCDVIYIPGVDAAFDGLQKIVQRIRPGGLLILNVPAYSWLRSDHDLAIHTRERYVAAEMAQLLNQLDLQQVLLTYRLCALLPLVVASRLPSMLWPSKNVSDIKSSLKPAGHLSNLAFGQVMRFENRMIDAGLSMPWGSSVFAVGRRVFSPQRVT